MQFSMSISHLKEIDIVEVALALGLEVIRNKCLCPFHADNHPSLALRRATGRFKCFACGATGSGIDLVMGVKSCSFSEACQWLASTFAEGSKVYYPQHTRRRNPSSPLVPDLEYLEHILHKPVINEFAIRFFTERKISLNVVESLGISSIMYDMPMYPFPFSPRFDGPALLIPYRDVDGNLMTVQSRYLGDENRPRFRFPTGSKIDLFNAPALKNCESLYIAEGVTDCLALLTLGVSAIAIPSATLLSLKSKSLLQKLTCPIFMCPDNDEPGMNLYNNLKKLLPNLHIISVPHPCKDVGDWLKTGLNPHKLINHDTKTL